MKCQILFSGKNKKNVSLLSAELAKSVVKVTNVTCQTIFCKLNRSKYNL